MVGLSWLSWVLSVIPVILLVIVIIAMWKTGEYFNTLENNDKYRPLIAWDLLLLFIGAICLVIKIVMV